MSGLKLQAGETISVPWRRPVKVTPRLAETVPLARAALLLVAQLGRTVTYKQLSVAVDRRYSPRSLGNVLDLVSVDCRLRHEPSLAALVLRGDTNEPGDGWIGDAQAEQKLCFEHWS
jgi:hypothetical protein